MYGVGSGIIYLQDFSCSSYDQSIFDCDISRYSCGHDRDVAVACFEGNNNNQVMNFCL